MSSAQEGAHQLPLTPCDHSLKSRSPAGRNSSTVAAVEHSSRQGRCENGRLVAVWAC
jgi:hypothetical protein